MGACLVSSAAVVLSLIALISLLSVQDPISARILQISQEIGAWQSSVSVNTATIGGELHDIQDELGTMTAPKAACWHLTPPSGGRPGQVFFLSGQTASAALTETSAISHAVSEVIWFGLTASS